MEKHQDDWKPTGLEYLRSDVRALGRKLGRLQGAMHKALCASGEPHVHVLQDAMHQILGEHTTGYWLRVREGETHHFESWAERERAIVKLQAAGETSIEIAELPARCCMPTDWRAAGRVRARRKVR